MKYSIPKDAFRDVKLSQENLDALTLEADTVVRETLAANEAFLESDATFQERQWKCIREKEGLRVYCQRRKSRRNSKTPENPWRPEPVVAGTRRFSKSSSRYRNFDESSTGTEASMSTYSAFAENTIMDKMKPESVPLMALHGTMDGTLDDCLFGWLASTDDAWRLRSSHLRERVDDARILAVIKTPKRDNPFRFLGVKWFTQENSTMLSSIMQQRDFLVVESSGFTRDSEGEKVGYFMMHSIKLRDVPELSDAQLVRGTRSFCCIFRQSKPNQVSVHSLGFFDSRGGMPGRMTIAAAAEGIIGVTCVVEYAFTQKLMWLMSQNVNQPTDTAACYCQTCGKNLTKFLLSGSSGPCRICHLVVCAKCSVIKKLTVDISDSGVAQQCSFRFCMGCLVSTKKRSSAEMVFTDSGRSAIATISKSRLVSEPQTDLHIDELYPGLQSAQSHVRQCTKYPERKQRENSELQSLSCFDKTSLPPRSDPAVKELNMRSFRANKAVHEYLDDYEFQARKTYI